MENGRGSAWVRVAVSPEEVEPEPVETPWSQKEGPTQPLTWEFIILGFLGGRFRNGSKEVTVRREVSNATGVRKVELATKGQQARSTTEMPVQAFLEAFQPQRIEGLGEAVEREQQGEQRGQEGLIDFKELPRSLKILRSVSLMGWRASRLALVQTQAFLSAGNEWQACLGRAQATAVRVEE